jgi:hypothetical protein
MTKHNYRNQIKVIQVFFSLHYKDYFSVGIRKVSEADQVNLDLFCWKSRRYDLIYTGINVHMVKVFLLGKQKLDGNNF